MEATEAFPDTNVTRVLVAAPEYEGQSENWLRRHANVSKVSFVMDTRATSVQPKFSVYYAPNNAVRFSLRFHLEWPDFEIVSFEGSPFARERAAERNTVCKLQLAHLMDEGKHVHPFCMISPQKAPIYS
jgi:hypothetical protein